MRRQPKNLPLQHILTTTTSLPHDALRITVRSTEAFPAAAVEYESQDSTQSPRNIYHPVFTAAEAGCAKFEAFRSASACTAALIYIVLCKKSNTSPVLDTTGQCGGIGMQYLCVTVPGRALFNNPKSTCVCHCDPYAVDLPIRLAVQASTSNIVVVTGRNCSRVFLIRHCHLLAHRSHSRL